MIRIISVIILITLAYYLLNWYLYSRSLMLFPFLRGFITWYRLLFIFLALSYPLGAFLIRYTPQSFLSIGIAWISSYWMGIQFYALVLFAVADIFLMIARIPGLRELPVLSTPAAQLLFLGIMGVLLIYGHINSRQITVKELTLKLPRKEAARNSLRIVLASDMHIGTIIHNSRVAGMVSAINNLHPDVILLAGDILDGELPHDIRLSIGHLSKLRARYGVYAVPGNHEYIAGIDRSLNLIQQAGITILRDDSDTIAESLTIIGRDDISKSRFGRGTRMPLSKLLDRASAHLPVLLMDHQPYNLEQSDDPRIDLQVSGHTHNGQISPFTYLVRVVYPLTWGLEHGEYTHYYVSCGLGTWGPPLRIGSNAEVVTIDLGFE